MSFSLLRAAFSELSVTGRTAGTLTQSSAWIWSGKWSEVPEPGALFEPPVTGGSRYVDPVSRAAIAAVRPMADLLQATEPSRRGCIVATRTANAFSVAQCESARARGKRASPLLFAHAGWNVPSALAATEMNCRGYVATLCAGERPGAELMGCLGRVFLLGRGDMVLAGVAELRSRKEPEEPLRAFALVGLFGSFSETTPARRLEDSFATEILRVVNLPEEGVDFLRSVMRP